MVREAVMGRWRGACIGGNARGIGAVLIACLLPAVAVAGPGGAAVPIAASSCLALSGPAPRAPEPPADAPSDDQTACAQTDAQNAADGASEGAADDSSEELVNRIKWSTASEVDNFGYNVYRGTSEDGPFERVNEEIIEGAGTTDLTSRYEFVDETIDPDTAYWYYVESIAMDGTRERFTPVVRVAPKRGQEQRDEAGKDAPRASQERQAEEEHGGEEPSGTP